MTAVYLLLNSEDHVAVVLRDGVLERRFEARDSTSLLLSLADFLRWRHMWWARDEWDSKRQTLRRPESWGVEVWAS